MALRLELTRAEESKRVLKRWIKIELILMTIRLPFNGVREDVEEATWVDEP